MASIDANSPAQNTANAQKALFDKLGISSQTDASKRGTSNNLGQEDFLKLMTTQLQNQDPFAPHGKWGLHCANGAVFHSFWHSGG